MLIYIKSWDCLKMNCNIRLRVATVDMHRFFLLFLMLLSRQQRSNCLCTLAHGLVVSLFQISVLMCTPYA